MLKAGGKKKEADIGLELRYQKDRRKYFRINTDPKKPVFFEDESAKYLVAEISAGGMAFEAGSFVPGRKYQGRLFLPGRPPTNWITAVAVRQVPSGLVGAEFKAILEDDREVIHTYVHQRQKEELLKKKQKDPDQD